MLKVELSKPKEYYGGDFFDGIVHCELNKPLFIRELRLEFKGTEKGIF